MICSVYRWNQMVSSQHGLDCLKMPLLILYLLLLFLHWSINSGCFMETLHQNHFSVLFRFDNILSNNGGTDNAWWGHNLFALFIGGYVSFGWCTITKPFQFKQKPLWHHKVCMTHFYNWPLTGFLSRTPEVTMTTCFALLWWFISYVLNNSFLIPLLRPNQE